MNKKTIYLILLLFPTVFFSCKSEEKISLHDVMQILKTKDSTINEFIANVKVKFYHDKDNTVYDSLTGIRFYKKPDYSLLDLISQTSANKYLTSEEGVTIRASNNNKISTTKINDSFFLHDLRYITNLYFENSKFPINSKPGIGKPEFVFDNNSTQISKSPSNMYKILCIVKNYEEMEMTVDLNNGEVIEKIVISLPDNKQISKDRYDNYKKYNDGFLPTFITYWYKGMRAEIQLDIFRVNTELPNSIFVNLNYSSVKLN